MRYINMYRSINLSRVSKMLNFSFVVDRSIRLNLRRILTLA
jgi:hypothetical protein